MPGTSAARKAANLSSRSLAQATSQAQETSTALPSLRSFVEALILAGVIPPEKAEAARAAVATPVQAAVISRDLQLHDRGEDVRALQRHLIAKGYLAAGNDVGVFGQMTLRSLKAYQASVGVPATGYCGPLTRAAMAK